MGIKICLFYLLLGVIFFGVTLPNFLYRSEIPANEFGEELALHFDETYENEK